MSRFTHSDLEDDLSGIVFLAAGSTRTSVPSVIQEEDLHRRPSAKELVATLDEEPCSPGLLRSDISLPRLGHYVENSLNGAIFVGHLVTDLDSIAGAIGAAELYGGVPAKASEINSETKFALARWGVKVPTPIEEVMVTFKEKKICLVDHQQTSQVNPSIDISRIVGVIDHHALQNSTIVTSLPIYIDIRPWGSMSTIIGHSFITQRRRPSTSTAGMLLCAILSDTLNLCGPTTTDYDRQLVSILAELAGVDDIEALAQEQFKAKSQELAACSCEILVNGDQKGFKFNTPTFQGEIGFAVIETIDDEVITARSAELRDELIVCKKKKGLAGLFLAVVNIVLMRSTLILCGETEKSLASAAWDHCTVTGDTMNIGSEVSRKLNFIPRITNAIKDKCWTPPK